MGASGKKRKNCLKGPRYHSKFSVGIRKQIEEKNRFKLGHHIRLSTPEGKPNSLQGKIPDHHIRGRMERPIGGAAGSSPLLTFPIAKYGVSPNFIKRQCGACLYKKEESGM